MQMISKFNKGFRSLSHVIDIYSKYAWVIPFKDKKGITITNVFQKTLNESNRKRKRIEKSKSKKKLGLKKQTREKAKNYMLNEKAMIVHLTVGEIKKA